MTRKFPDPETKGMSFLDWWEATKHEVNKLNKQINQLKRAFGGRLSVLEKKVDDGISGLHKDHLKAAASRKTMKDDISDMRTEMSEMKVNFASMQGSFNTIKYFLLAILGALVFPQIQQYLF